MRFGEVKEAKANGFSKEIPYKYLLIYPPSSYGRLFAGAAVAGRHNEASKQRKRCQTCAERCIGAVFHLVPLSVLHFTTLISQPKCYSLNGSRSHC